MWSKEKESQVLAIQQTIKLVLTYLVSCCHQQMKAAFCPFWLNAGPSLHIQAATFHMILEKPRHASPGSPVQSEKQKTKTKTGHSLLKCKYGMHSVCNMFQWSHTMPGLMRWGYSVSISKTSFELFARIQLARYKTVSFMYNWTWEKGSELFFSHSFCCSDLSSGVVGSIEKDRIGKRYIGFLHLWKFS